MDSLPQRTSLPTNVADLASFQQHLGLSRRVIAVVGSGLSAASGLAAFKGDAIWHGFDAAELATPEAFDVDPGLVWQFYAWRRRLAMNASPNAGHVALARLAQRWPDRFLVLTQNADALSERAGHPPQSLVHLHGDMFSVRCTRPRCGYKARNFDPKLGEADVPLCPRCEANLRPAVIWFGEQLPYEAIFAANSAIESGEVDLLLCIGMSAWVWPAAGYVDEVVQRGGKVAVFNPDGALRRNDAWFFSGGAEHSLALALAPVIGDLEPDPESSELSELSELSS